MTFNFTEEQIEAAIEDHANLIDIPNKIQSEKIWPIGLLTTNGRVVVCITIFLYYSSKPP